MPQYEESLPAAGFSYTEACCCGLQIRTYAALRRAVLRVSQLPESFIRQLRNAAVLSSFGLHISRVHLENEHFAVLSAIVRQNVFLWQTSHQNVVFDAVHWETCSPSEGSFTSFAIDYSYAMTEGSDKYGHSDYPVFSGGGEGIEFYPGSGKSAYGPAAFEPTDPVTGGRAGRNAV